MGFRIHHWPEIPPIFKLVQEKGSLTDEEMFSAFNTGVGFGIVVLPDDKEKALSVLNKTSNEAVVLGECTDDPDKNL